MRIFLAVLQRRADHELDRDLDRLRLAVERLASNPLPHRLAIRSSQRPLFESDNARRSLLRWLCLSGAAITAMQVTNSCAVMRSGVFAGSLVIKPLIALSRISPWTAKSTARGGLCFNVRFWG